MSDYPSNTPWGPHGPQVNVPSTTPNPTAPWTEPAPGGGGSEWATSTSGGGGGAPVWGGGGGAGPAWSLTVWLRNLAIAGAVIGVFVGAARGYLLHAPGAALGPLALRAGIAGGAIGASIPPLFRAAGWFIRGAIWFGIVAILWIVAAVALGQTSWFPRLH